MDVSALSQLSGTVQDRVHSITTLIGVDYTTLHLFLGGDDAKNRPYVKTNYPDAWVSHYLLNDYVRIDPVLQMAEQSHRPFCWSALALGPEHQEMMEQAHTHGLGPIGFSVSHVDTGGRRSVLSCNARTAQGGETWVPFLEDHHQALQDLTAQMHNTALVELFGPSDPLPQLSPREIECLKWTAEGKAHTEIAVILNLSEHTVRGYLKEARLKLDSVSLAQAVSKAASLGII